MGKKSGVAQLIYASLTICLLISVVLAGCTKETSKQETSKLEASNDLKSSEPSHGGTLRMIWVDNITNIGYPADQRVSSNLYFVQPVFETLGRYDETGKITPWLTESWQTDPKMKTITIKLKKGIKFHDNTDFNSEAVKWNIEEYQKAKRAEVNGIQSIDVIDENTVRLNLVEWNNSLLESVAYYVKMASPTAITKNGKEWANNNPVGTGPFKFVSWEKDVSLKFKKNENYWQNGKPYLDAIEYSLIYDRNTAAIEFKSGKADVFTQMNADDYIELEKSGKYVTRSDEKIAGALVGVGLMFDSANPDSPFANVKVRQAAMHAVDSKAIADSVLRGLAVPTNQWNNSSHQYYNPDVKGFPYDPEKAKQLLAEAGYPNGFKTKITTDAPRVQEMTAIQSYLAKVGIDAQVISVDTPKWVALIGDKWDGMVMSYRVLSPSTIVQMNRLLSKDAALYAKSIIHPDKVEKLLADARTAPDFESSKKAVLELQKVVFDEYAISFPTFSLINGIAFTPKVQNLGMFTTNALDWNPEDTWMKK